MRQPKQSHPRQTIGLVTLGFSLMGTVLINVHGANSNSVPTSSSSLTLPSSYPTEVRTMDGTGNNLIHPMWGSANIPFLRLTEVEYSDGSGSPAGTNRASARAISNRCATQIGDMPSGQGATDLFWQWGQFLDHDIDLTPVISPIESFDIEVPAGDPWFDPQGTGTESIPLTRSFYTIVDGVRQQINEISAYIDASQVYGSDPQRAEALRTFDGTGRLKVSTGDLLHFNEAGLPNSPSAEMPNLFLAGDIRANEQVGLVSMHTLFVREHNHWADAIREGDPLLSGDAVYQAARTIVAAEMQAITYREFLPVLLGRKALSRYQGYDPEINPGIANEFATAAFRFGHTMLSGQLLRLSPDGQPIANGHLSLAEAFLGTSFVVQDGIDPILRGLAAQVAQEVDSLLIDGVRNLLFGPPGSGGFDLASLNIQRGRDHGLADLNQTRIDYGLPPLQSFADINADPDIQQGLTEAYGDVNEIDLWVGGLSESHVDGALVGPTFHAILKDQFERLRDGDRFWYEHHLPQPMVNMINRQTLHVIIRRNTSIGEELPSNVFVATE